MSIYASPSPEVMKVISSYKKAFEDVTISKPALVSGKLYREVVFSKRALGKFGENPKSYLYLDENNNVVDHKNTIEKLGRVFFYMDAFLSDDKDSIIKALQKDGEVEKNSNDFQRCLVALEIINKRENKKETKKDRKNSDNDIEKEEDSRAAKAVEDILLKLNVLRGKTNERLKVLLEKIEEEKTKHEYFNEMTIEVLMPYYRDAMVCNYEKVQLISRGQAYYNDIKRKAEKARKSYALRFNTGNTEPLMKLHYTMGYFENLLRSYGNIATMSYNQYIKLIANSGKTNAEYKMLVLKNKVQ
ncbi:hypothetical protein [Clostridium sp.]|uniref:hypothetical protein n=1 Tax=Clostridium sp. TaxID=1506 RepID=UPI002FCB6C70